MKIISFQNDILPLKNQLYRLALRITMNGVEAEDIVQETMIKVWNKRDSWAEIDSIEAFCLTLCRNKATNRNDRMDTVRRLIDRLPEKQRSCMQLRDFEGKPYKEIAQILEISEEQVKVNIFRARQTVRQRYQELDNYGL